jgi:hypothetical protein
MYKFNHEPSPSATLVEGRVEVNMEIYIFFPISSSDANLCDLPERSGRCYAAFPRFYFNKTKGECLPFTYGGCDGNGNRFDTKRQCEKRCTLIMK